jgi:hypothetical protein
MEGPIHPISREGRIAHGSSFIRTIKLNGKQWKWHREIDPVRMVVSTPNGTAQGAVRSYSARQSAKHLPKPHGQTYM